MHNALKKQLLNATEPIYLCVHHDCHVGFANIHVYELLQFLFDLYGCITPTDLSNNSDHIKLPWDATTSFEMLINQIEECI